MQNSAVAKHAGHQTRHAVIASDNANGHNMRHEAWSAAGGSAKKQLTLHALLSKSDGNRKGSSSSQPLSGKKAPGKKSLHGIHHLFRLSLRTMTWCMP